MRFESATVPAAVMPDRYNDDGFVNYLPLSRVLGMGRLQKTGTSQKTCQTRLIFKAFGKKSAGSFIDSLLNSCKLRIKFITENDKNYYGEILQQEKHGYFIKSKSFIYFRIYYSGI
jgi:hypothetical protein